MTTINSPWIKWDGGECPVPPDTRVKVQLRDGLPGTEDRAGNYLWNHDGNEYDIVEYQIVAEKAKLDASGQLLAAFGYAVTPPAKPFEDITPMTEPPPDGTGYWVVHPFSPDGVLMSHWQGISSDNSVLRRRMAYLDRDHALVAAKYIFGLKGGAL